MCRLRRIVPRPDHVGHAGTWSGRLASRSRAAAAARARNGKEELSGDGH